jgi:hypothetical protein
MNCLNCGTECSDSSTKPRKYCNDSCRIAHKRKLAKSIQTTPEPPPEPITDPKSIPGIVQASSLQTSGTPIVEDQFSPFPDSPKSKPTKHLDQKEPPIPRPKPFDYSQPPYTVIPPGQRSESINLDTPVEQWYKFYLV